MHRVLLAVVLPFACFSVTLLRCVMEEDRRERLKVRFDRENLEAAEVKERRRIKIILIYSRRVEND